MAAFYLPKKGRCSRAGNEKGSKAHEIPTDHGFDRFIERQNWLWPDLIQDRRLESPRSHGKLLVLRRRSFLAGFDSRALKVAGELMTL